MIDAKGGSIVNIASIAGITGVPRAFAYCASKSGIITFTKSMALEWHGIISGLTPLLPTTLKSI